MSTSVTTPDAPATGGTAPAADGPTVTAGGTAPAAGGAAPGWCDRCGEAASADSHDGCAAARTLEPPRFCAHCRRRMKVQVLPVGWSAVCVEHGEIRG